jgi:hypothetical protein
VKGTGKLTQAANVLQSQFCGFQFDDLFDKIENSERIDILWSVV